MGWWVGGLTEQARQHAELGGVERALEIDEVNVLGSNASYGRDHRRHGIEQLLLPEARQGTSAA
jgi:hypothetical protein